MNKILNRTHEQHHTRKSHLAQLPGLKDFPTWKRVRKDIALVIPLFSFTDAVDSVIEYLAKAAAWSLWTWVSHSDLKKYGASCYIYIESGATADAALPILRSENVPEQYIKVVDFDRTAWLGKCLQPIFDKDLEGFEYLCISDSDMFVVPGLTGEPLTIGENILGSKEKGIGCTLQYGPMPGYWIPHLRHLFEYTNETDFDENLDVAEVWLHAFQALTGTDVSDYWGKHPDKTPWTGLMIVSKDAFSNKEKDFLEKASRVFGDDEAVLYAWLKQDSKHKIWDVKTIGIDIQMSIMHYMETAYKGNQNVNQKGWLHFDDTFIPKPCIVHHFCSLEHKFQTMTGMI